MSLWLLILTLLFQAPAQQAQVAGSTACQSCHADMYARWSDSIHGRMIQRANKASVVSHPELMGGPATSKMWKDGVLYIVENGIENKIDYTLGNRRVQHYLTTRPDGKIEVLHSSWDIKRGQWFDSKDIVQGAPRGFVQQWNMTCFYCHVTQQVQDVKGFDPKTLGYKTAWVESSATCERCHGPMAAHAFAAADGNAESVRSARPAAAFDKLIMCGQCHWAKNVLAPGFTTRKAYFDYYSPSLMHLDPQENTSDPSWWVDGRPRRFSNEAAAFFLSGCFQSGKAMCTSCHDPHWNRTDGNDALMKNADQYCINCHADLKSESHTHHAAETAGASCVGCHMPHAVVGVKTTMRDHSMSFPEPENTVRYGVPNACNECHSDKSADWALQSVEKWYPGRSVRPRLRATAFTLAEKGDARAVNSLVRLATDQTENTEIRASATGFLGRFPSDLSTNTLIALTRDKEPMIRVEAARSLGAVPEQKSAIALTALLDDPYLAVRIHAAGSLTAPLFPGMTFSAVKQKSFDKAVNEYRRSLEGEGDHPNVETRLGSLEASLGNADAARAAYGLALRLDPVFADAYVGLAIVEMQAGHKEEALRNARKAVEVSGKDVYKKFLAKLEQSH